MVGHLPRVLILITVLFATLALSGCGDDRPEQIAKYQQLTQQRLDLLASSLDNNQLRNATLLKQYTRVLAQRQSDLTPLLEELAKDASTEGPMFKSLTRRYKDLNDSANFIDLDQQLAEAQNIYQAADTSLYNDMLSDPVNVVADMSKGQLARVNAISREAEALANGTDGSGAGSQLVGNPA